MPNLTGQSIGRYHILDQLGEGGMATVFKAYDTRLERNVALKVLRTDQFIPAQLQMVLQRFEREAKSLAKLKHPSIVNILDFGEHDGMPYLVMEYLPGGTLKQKLGLAIPWREAIQILLPVARGLAYAHQHGVIHRDVKPANVLIDQNDEPILTDFGIAKLLEGTSGHTLTASGVGIGTPEYMAPEQGIGASAIDARADIYSLGIVLYEMVTGRKPYIADTPMAVVIKQINDPLPRPTDFVTDLPEGVEHILFKALAKQPEDRYENMDAFIAAMESLLAEAQSDKASAPVKQLRQQVAPRTKPSLKAVTAVIGVLAIILVFVFGMPWPNRQFSSTPTVEATLARPSAISPTLTFSPPPPTSTSTPEPSLTPTESFTQTPTAFPTEITDAKGVSMRLVPAGEFTMGANDSFADVKPAHQINLDAFYIDKFEVTNEMYKECVNANVCAPPQNVVLDHIREASAGYIESTDTHFLNVGMANIYEYYYGNLDFKNYPVVYVTWSMAKAYCENWRAAHLPTEAEWEKAARGTRGNSYPWGNQFDCAKGNFGDAFLKNFYSSVHYSFSIQEAKCDGYTGTYPVGHQPAGASMYGVFDLAGNVAEWTNDIFMPYPYSPRDENEGVADEGRLVIRGGSFFDSGDNILSFYRQGVFSSDFSSSTVGFRCAVSAMSGETAKPISTLSTSTP